VARAVSFQETRTALHRRRRPPSEAVEILVDRSTLSDWRPLAAALAADPWGPLAQTVKEIIGLACHYGIDRISDYENARMAPTTDVLARLEDILERHTAHPS
jgi:hypothetical protein